LSKPYKIGSHIDIRVEKIVPRGLGLGFAENLTVMVPLAAPGDELRVRITELKKRLAFAEIVEIKAPGPARIKAPCPYFGRCGGCDFQQLTYEAQLEAKAGIIRDCLHRIGKIEYGGEIRVVPSPNEFGYRSRARWHLDREKKAIGYMARDSHTVIDILECPILAPDLQGILQATRGNVNWEGMWGETAQIEAAAGDQGSASAYSPDLPEAASEILLELNGDSYAFSAQTFFQANKGLLPALIEAATHGAPGRLAFDLYAGVGLFSLPLARRFERVVAVEGSAVSVGFARRNAAGIAGAPISVVNQGVDIFLAEYHGDRPDLILIDPPRSGPESTMIDVMASLDPAEISYVSCEPSILARDLRILIDRGYEIEKLTALDLFPQTHHVETVVRLRRQNREPQRPDPPA